MPGWPALQVPIPLDGLRGLFFKPAPGESSRGVRWSNCFLCFTFKSLFLITQNWDSFQN